MNLNTCLNYTTSRRLNHSGHAVHIQASAITPDVGTILLVFQGRATHVRAFWAAFHEKSLINDAYFPRANGQAYLKPNPIINLPSGVQYWLIHHDLTPKHVDSQPHFYTFGPGHFHAMMSAATAVPLLPHWELPVFQWGRDAGLITSLPHCFNVQLYQVDRDLVAWLDLLQQHHKELTYEPQ